MIKNILFNDRVLRRLSLLKAFLFNKLLFSFFLLFLSYTANASTDVSSGVAQGPFFWQITKDGKSSYILGTMHDDVRFEELQCHQEIKDYLILSDFLLTEIGRDLIYLYELNSIFEGRSRFQNTNPPQGLSSLSPSSQDFFTQKLKEFEEAYYERYEQSPPIELSEAFYKYLNQASYFKLGDMIYNICHYPFFTFLDFIDYNMNSVLLSPSDLEPTNLDAPSDLESTNRFQDIFQAYLSQAFFIGHELLISLDQQILDIFLDHKQNSLEDQNINLSDQFFSPINSYIKQERALLNIHADDRLAEKEVLSKITSLMDQVLSSGEELKKFIDHIASSREELSRFIDRLPKPLEGKELLVDQFVSPLNDLATEIIGFFVMESIPQKEDVEEWIQNFDKRCSEDQIAKIENVLNSYPNESRFKTDFIQGIPLNIEEEYQYLWRKQNPGFLDAEIKQALLFITKYVMDFRNEMWRSKIIKAHSQQNRLFVTGGVEHFVEQNHRNLLNLKALEQYAQDNQTLPNNVLDMLKQEGFTIQRMSADCSFE